MTDITPDGDFYASVNSADRVEIIISEARKSGNLPARQAIISGHLDVLRSLMIWKAPKDDIGEDDAYSSTELCLDDVYPDCLTKFCASIARTIQFPKDTAYLHGLGVVATAMARRFTYNYYGSNKPVNLYVVSAQPPSSGKSGVNSYLADPVRKAYREVTESNMKQRKKIESRINKARKDMKDQDGEAVAVIAQDIESMEWELANLYPIYRYSLDDATAEAIEAIAARQHGLFNLVSDESDCINILMGNVYKDTGGNKGLFLKGWDGDWHSSARITREGVEMKAVGSIAVIAQDESIESILQAGISGRGVSERMLILREKHNFGTRNRSKYVPIDSDAKELYSQTVNALVKEEPTVLEFTPEALAMISEYAQSYELDLADDGQFSHPMLRGAIGKSDKQVCKISCVLHGVWEWQPGGNRSKKISKEITGMAILLHRQLIDTYINAADSKEFVGYNTRSKDIIRILTQHAQKKNTIIMPLRNLRDAVKGLKAFKGMSKLTDKLKDEFLPELEQNHILVFDNKNIYINPKLMG